MEASFERNQLESLLQRLGEVLEAGGTSASIVIVGGAALNLLGVISRATVDIDVIATGEVAGALPPTVLAVPSELPANLKLAVERLTRDLALPAGWINTTVTSHGRQELPPGFVERVAWKQYRRLWVGIAGRQDLIALKLHAAADTDVRSRHTTDLLALHPTVEELEAAAEWVRRQDAGAEFPSLVAKVIAHVAARTQ
jgi:hypothetical protein